MDLNKVCELSLKNISTLFWHLYKVYKYVTAKLKIIYNQNFISMTHFFSKLL